MKCLWIRGDRSQDIASGEPPSCEGRSAEGTPRPVVCSSSLLSYPWSIHSLLPSPQPGGRGGDLCPSQAPCSCRSLEGSRDCSCLHWSGGELGLQPVLLQGKWTERRKSTLHLWYSTGMLKTQREPVPALGTRAGGGCPGENVRFGTWRMTFHFKHAEAEMPFTPPEVPAGVASVGLFCSGFPAPLITAWQRPLFTFPSPFSSY